MRPRSTATWCRWGGERSCSRRNCIRDTGVRAPTSNSWYRVSGVPWCNPFEGFLSIPSNRGALHYWGIVQKNPSSRKAPDLPMNLALIIAWVGEESSRYRMGDTPRVVPPCWVSLSAPPLLSRCVIAVTHVSYPLLPGLGHTLSAGRPPVRTGYLPQIRDGSILRTGPVSRDVTYEQGAGDRGGLSLPAGAGWKAAGMVGKFM
jgi:hypothetical protein